MTFAKAKRLEHRREDKTFDLPPELMMARNWQSNEGASVEKSSLVSVLGGASRTTKHVAAYTPKKMHTCKINGCCNTVSGEGVVCVNCMAKGWKS